MEAVLDLDEVVRVLAVEWLPIPEAERPRLENFMFERWGNGDEVHAALRLVVKNLAQLFMSAFDDLPKDLRERLSESDYNLDPRALLDHYASMGEKACFHAISQMEGTAKILVEAAFWKSLGLTPFAKFKEAKTGSYAEAVKAKWDAGMEAVRRSNEARSN